MTANEKWTEIAKRYGVEVPACVKALYETSDGESTLRGGWRLHSAAELLELNWEDGWLDHKSAGSYVRSLGGLLPLYTNDNSNLIVLHCGGPLDGRLSYFGHDDGNISLVCHSVATFEAERAKAGEGRVFFGQYLLGTPAEYNQGIRIANKMRKALGIPDDVDLDFLAHVWTAFRGGYPERPE